MSETMTPRERVLATLNHKEPDRVPITLGGSANHLTEQRYVLLRDHFGVQDIPRRTLVGFYTTPDYNPVLDKLGTDFRFIHIRPPQNYISNSMIGEFQEFVDEWGITHRLVSGYYDLHGAPLGKDLSIEKIDKYPWPDPYDPARLEGVKEEIEHLYNNTNYAIVAHRPVYGNLWEMTRALVGMENALLLTISDTHIFDHLLGKLAEVLDGFYDAFLSVVGPYVQIVEMADDYGTNAGPMFNPNVYTKFFKPRYKKSIEMIKRKAPNAKVLVTQRRRDPQIHSRPDRDRFRYSQPHRRTPARHGSCRTETRFRKGPHIPGRCGCEDGSSITEQSKMCAVRSACASSRWAKAAATSLRQPIISAMIFPLKTCSPFLKRA
jgi:hypothetical protein